MITEKELFEIGFRRIGDEDNDPFYQVFLDQSVLNIFDISGNFDRNGGFQIYSIKNRTFNEISEIQEIFSACRFQVNWKIMNKYGSKELN